jgi:hypothetical protein
MLATADGDGATIHPAIARLIRCFHVVHQAAQKLLLVIKHKSEKSKQK